MNDETYERVFRKRAIDKKIAEARPHVVFDENAVASVVAADPLWQADKRFARTIVEQSSGIAMLRWPAIEPNGQPEPSTKRSTSEEVRAYAEAHPQKEVTGSYHYSIEVMEPWWDEWVAHLDSTERSRPIMAELRPDHPILISAKHPHRHDASGTVVEALKAEGAPAKLLKGWVYGEALTAHLKERDDWSDQERAHYKTQHEKPEEWHRHAEDAK